MRKFLVVLDDTRECLNAMRFAALRAARTGGGVQILSIIPPEEFQHWMGVADLMRAEARERIEAHFEVFAKWMRDKQGINPELVIREGDPVTEILAQVREDGSVGVLVLGAGSDKGGAGAFGHGLVAVLGQPAHSGDDRAGGYEQGAAGEYHLRCPRVDTFEYTYISKA